MAIGMYEGPAEQKFVDTYAPLPFQEIMQVGQAFQRERERTEEEMREFRSEFADFMSPSDIDATKMDQATYGAVRPHIEKMRVDPEYIRSQEGQAVIKGAMQSINRGTVARLRQGAENLRERQKNIAKLQAEGKYNPDWDKYADLSKYSTLDEGPIDPHVMEYKSLETMANEYTSNVKPGYISPINRYEYWYGISEDAIRNSLVQQFDSVTKTPQGQAHLNDIAKELGAQGITDPNAIRQEMLDRMVQSQKDRMVKDIKTDEAQLKLAEIWSKRTPGDKTTPGIPRLTDMFKAAGESQLQGLESRMMQNEIIGGEDKAFSKAYQDAVKSGNRNKADEITAQYNAWRSNNFRELNRSAFSYGANVDKPEDARNYRDIADGSKKVLENYSYNPGVEAANTAISGLAHKGDIKKNESGLYTLSNPKDLLTTTALATRMDGIEITPPKYGLEKLIKEGAIKAFDIESTGNVVSQVMPNGSLRQFLEVGVKFNEDQIDRASIYKMIKRDPRATLDPAVLGSFSGIPSPSGAFTTLIENAGGKHTIEGATYTTTRTDSQREIIQSKDRLLGSKSKSETQKGDDKDTYRITGYLPIPDESVPGDELAVVTINDLWNQRTQTQKVSGAQLPEDVGVTYDAALQRQSTAADVLQQWKNRAAEKKAQ